MPSLKEAATTRHQLIKTMENESSMVSHVLILQRDSWKNEQFKLEKSWKTYQKG